MRNLSYAEVPDPTCSPRPSIAESLAVLHRADASYFSKLRATNVKPQQLALERTISRLHCPGERRRVHGLRFSATPVAVGCSASRLQDDTPCIPRPWSPGPWELLSGWRLDKHGTGTQGFTVPCSMSGPGKETRHLREAEPGISSLQSSLEQPLPSGKYVLEIRT